MLHTGFCFLNRTLLDRRPGYHIAIISTTLLLAPRLLGLRHSRPARPRQGGAGKEEPEAAEALVSRAAPELELRSRSAQVGTRAGNAPETGSRGGRGHGKGHGRTQRMGRAQALVPAAGSRPMEPPPGARRAQSPPLGPGLPPRTPSPPRAPGSFPAALHPL